MSKKVLIMGFNFVLVLSIVLIIVGSNVKKCFSINAMEVQNDDGNKSITTLENLYDILSNSEIESMNSILEDTTEEVKNQFYINEIRKGMEQIENISSECLEHNVNTKIVSNKSGYRVVKSKTNEYGVKVSVEMEDISEDVPMEKGWRDAGVVVTKEKKEYGDRKFTARGGITIANKKAIVTMFTLGYRVSEKGLTTRYLSTDGTKSNIPLVQIETINTEWNDEVATKVGANIDATAMFQIKVEAAFGLDWTTSKQKINASVKILEWNKEKKYMNVEHKAHHYEGQRTILS